jgi:hypothetical protein
MKIWQLLGILSALPACSAQNTQPGISPSAPDAAEWRKPSLDPAYASKAVKLSLHCVETPEPHYLQRVGFSPRTIRQWHPAFFGCSDWHSAVHGHWAMLRAVDQVPSLPEQREIVNVLSRHLNAVSLQKEISFQEANPAYERPYGWAWALRLAEEVHASRLPEAKRWAKAIGPFEESMVRLITTYMKELKEPNRKGLHYNTAYALVHAWDYAVSRDRSALKQEIEAFARAAYLTDRNCNLAGEPGPHDFISPCFVEADLMRRVLSREEFSAWLDGFLPSVSAEHLRPVMPPDLNDYHQVHLVGLMYQKAGAMLGVAERLAPGDPRRATLIQAARAQERTAWDAMFRSNYAGTHWLASFAIYYYTAIGLGGN